MKIQRLVALLPAITLYCAAQTPPQATPDPLNTEPIKLEPMAIKAIKERVEIYQNKADTIFDGLRLEKKIRYSDVIANSYDTSKFNLTTILVAKKKYRDAVAKEGHTFFCNYAAFDKEIPVYFEMYDEMRGHTTNGGGMGGSFYFFKKKKIQIRQGGDKTKIYHAAGAALSSFIAPENLDRIKEMGKKKQDADFVRQVNFEVRLQDLNRFYGATHNGCPIMNPIEAVIAIVSMGEPLKRDMVQKILERNHIAYKPEALDKALATPRTHDAGNSDDGFGETTFTVARRLIKGMTAGEYADENGSAGSRTVEDGLELLRGKEYEAYLERILIEAPGHI